MKLLIYSHFFAPSIGGVESAVLSLAGGLTALRTASGRPQFEVILVTQTPAGDFDSRSLPFPILRQPNLARLWRAIRRADVIHVAGPALPPLIMGWLARVPTVIEHHGYQAICPNGLLVHEPDDSICPGHFQSRNFVECVRCRSSEISTTHSLIELLLMFPRIWLARRAARNLAISEHVLKRHGLPRASVAYYGIEDPLQRGVAQALPVPTGKLAFAYVGRFFPEKGVLVLLRAAEMLRREGFEFELRLIGDGPQRPELERAIGASDLGSYAHITGYLSGEDLARSLRDVAVVVMPSVCEETAGLAAIEQMMRGRLVIASQIGGLAEVVGDTGLTFPAGDAHALAERMKMVMRNPGMVASLGERARLRALTLFTRNKMVAQHARVYHEVREGVCQGQPRPSAEDNSGYRP